MTFRGLKQHVLAIVCELATIILVGRLAGFIVMAISLPIIALGKADPAFALSITLKINTEGAGCIARVPGQDLFRTKDGGRRSTMECG